jgi:hypothetical protein
MTPDQELMDIPKESRYLSHRKVFLAEGKEKAGAKINPSTHL